MSLDTRVTLIANFLKEMAEIGHFSPHTLRAYKKDLEQVFFNSMNESKEINNIYIDFKINEINLLKLAKEAQISWTHLEPSSRQRKSATIKSFFNWLYEKKIISTPLNHKIESPKAYKKIPHFISIDEVLLLFKSLDQLKLPQEKVNAFRALLFLLYGGGLRISEACHIQWKNIRFSSNEIRILGKGNKERWVALPASVLKAVQQLPRVGDFIWGENSLDTRKAFGWIRKMGKEAGLTAPLHPHALRHSYATHLISSGINLRALQELLGHASLSSTEKYTHLSLNQLARTLEVHHPLGVPKLKNKNDLAS